MCETPLKAGYFILFLPDGSGFAGSPGPEDARPEAAIVSGARSSFPGLIGPWRTSGLH